MTHIAKKTFLSLAIITIPLFSFSCASDNITTQRLPVDQYQGHGQPPRTVRLIVYPTATSKKLSTTPPPNRYPLWTVSKPKGLNHE